MELQPGKSLAHYRLVEKIGEGGMGVVWKAEDSRLGRVVAVKVLRQHLADDERSRERFEREARAASSLNHPHICTVHEVGRQDGIDYLVMEHLEGESLAEALKAGPLPLEQALRHGIEIAGALHEAHRARIIHRDLKPGNIMLTRRGVKLMDFGLARILSRPGNGGAGSESSSVTTVDQPLTDEGIQIGTLPYMSPEQLEGGPTDTRTDIFALGNVLYEMITGAPAFSAPSRAGLISAILTSEPPPVADRQPAAPALLDHLIRRCLAKSPDDRWHSALDLAGELEWIAGSSPANARTPAGRAPSSAGYRVEYFRSSDGASVAAARGGNGEPLLVVPTMVDTIETSWALYARAFPGRELITYDRRGTGLSERGSIPGEPDPYMQDARSVLDGFRVHQVDVLGTLLGTTEAAWLAAREPHRVKRLVLRAPTTGLDDWASIPGVRAALAALEHDWEYFTESFSGLVVGWGDPASRKMAERFRQITSKEELRALLQAFAKLDLISLYGGIQAPTLVEHHPGYFFPGTYSRRIASMIPDCRMVIFTGQGGAFITDLSAARTFLGTTERT